jgi:integrase
LRASKPSLAEVKRRRSAVAHIEKRAKNRWRARYRAPDGRERSKTFERRVDAERYVANIEADKTRGEWTDPRLGRERFTEYAARWLDTKADVGDRSFANIEGRIRNHLLPALGDLAIRDLRSSDVLAWRAKLKSERAPDTVNAALGTLRQILRAAVLDRSIARNPCDGINPLPKTSVKEIHPLKADHIPLLADALPDRFRCAIFTAAYTGLRAGELWALKVARVNLLRRTVNVVESVSETRRGLVTKPPKNGKARTVTLPRLIAEMLAEHIGDYPSRDGFVFTSPQGYQVRHRNFMDDHFYPALGRAESLPAGFRFHDLRHTHASILIARGWRPEQVKDRLGHGSIRTTFDWYGHLFENHDEALLDELDDAIRGSLVARSRPERGLAVPIHASGAH